MDREYKEILSLVRSGKLGVDGAMSMLAHVALPEEASVTTGGNGRGNTHEVDPQVALPASVGNAGRQAIATPATGASLAQLFLAELLEDIHSQLPIDEGDFDLDTPLMDMGVDSISATAFASFFADKYDIRLPPTVFFEFRDIRGFSGHLLDRYTEELRAYFGSRLSVAEMAAPVPPISRQAPVSAPPAPSAPALPTGLEPPVKPTGGARLSAEALWQQIEANIEQADGDQTDSGQRAAVARGHDSELDTLQLAAEYGMDAILVSPAGEPAVELFSRGAGEPILLLGGMGTRFDVWKHQIPFLAARYRVLAVHQPGSGRSGIDMERPLELGRIADSVVKALDVLGIRQPVPVVGYSFGGLVAQTLALTHPRRVAALVLACTSPVVDRDSLDVPALLRDVAAQRGSLRIYSEFDMDLVVKYETCAQGFDSRARLPGISVPALVVAGGRDGYMKASFSQQLARAMPDSQLCLVEEAGHFLVLSHPQPFNEQLGRFLARRLQSVAGSAHRRER